MVIKCGACKSKFHASCINRPVSAEVTAMILENPFIWWVCPGCMFKTPSGEDVIQENTALNALESLTEEIDSMKSDILREMPAIAKAVFDEKFKTNISSRKRKIDEISKEETLPKMPCIQQRPALVGTVSGTPVSAYTCPQSYADVTANSVSDRIDFVVENARNTPKRILRNPSAKFILQSKNPATTETSAQNTVKVLYTSL